MLCDLAVITLTLAACVYVRHLAGGAFELESYWTQWPIVLVYVLVLASFGGYDILASPPQELRSCTLASVLVIALLSSITFWVRMPFSYSRAIILSAGALLLALLPATHFAVKGFCARFDWWGYNTVFYVFEKRDAFYIKMMIDRLHSCLKPVLLLRHRPDSLDDHTVKGIPVLDGEHFLNGKGPRSTGVFIFLGYPLLGSGARSVLAKAEARFSRTIILHESLNFGNQWAKPVDMGQHFGLEVMQRLLDTKRLLAKTTADFLFSLLLLAALAPLFLLIAILIQLDSPGPVFFRHARLGRNGTTFRAWKFRTMVKNADAALKEALARDPELKAVWDERHKLPRDPRITAVGRFLRRTSLDELPQLFNVLAGEMSLIGPRPIVHAEVVKYGDKYDMISKVRPGMTGLWQVSGRSRLTYAERVELDAYYIKNWSFWLDMYILLKTPLAVLKFSNAV